MTRLKVISIAFLAGLVIGCSVPAKAFPVAVNKSFSGESVVKYVNRLTCSVTIGQTKYDLFCGDVDLFSQGNNVSTGSVDGQTVIVTVDGFEVTAK
ncbi:TPA: hypothetical protein JG872_000340 [Enterobacter hormaechei subsp. xiangfangensis]|nr:hypothetical protein [Enterobacter hormaechei subsp. xiangfangensis]HAV1860646.1 hypothetical protein [Enterobacter hormaechei subsp. xiangfangensis]